MRTTPVSMVHRLALVLPILAALGLLVPGQASAQKGKVGKMDTPAISCGVASAVSIEIQICGGATTGAPAGFSLQWMTATDFAANGDQWFSSDDPHLCKASFSGNASGFFYNLAPGQCVTVNVGDLLFDNPGASTNCDVPLQCGTEYVFRSFAHANSTRNRSDFTADLSCSTTACVGGGGCTFTQGYWKNHPEAWPVSSLELGSPGTTYTDVELLSIFGKPAAGNGLIALAHQLIAAKLNAANGADASGIQAAIDAADLMIGTLVVPPVGTGSLQPSLTSSLTSTLDAYNNGLTGPGHCP